MDISDKLCLSRVCIGSVLLNNFINYMDKRFKYTPRKFADGTKLSGAWKYLKDRMPEGPGQTQQVGPGKSEEF